MAAGEEVVKESTVSGKIDWYFDFISPFAYLQHCLLGRYQQHNPGLKMRYIPVLFAGLLGHHGHKGPAEIAAKRIMTYRFCHWLAQQHRIPFRMPAGHPFNPLPMLRAAIAKDCAADAIATLFEHCWVNSAADDGFASMARLEQLDGFDQIARLCAQDSVKRTLRHNTEAAAAKGLFGVPTIAIDDDLFWGFDMTEMAMARLGDAALMSDSEYQRINNLPVSQARR